MILHQFTPMQGSKWLIQTVEIMEALLMEAKEIFWPIKIRRESLTRWEVSVTNKS